MGDCGWLPLPALMARACCDSCGWFFVRRTQRFFRKGCVLDQCAANSIKPNQIKSGGSPPSAFCNTPLLHRLDQDGFAPYASFLHSLQDQWTSQPDIFSFRKTPAKSFILFINSPAHMLFSHNPSLLALLATHQSHSYRTPARRYRHGGSSSQPRTQLHPACIPA